jgi:hypothetical protein
MKATLGGFGQPVPRTKHDSMGVRRNLDARQLCGGRRSRNALALNLLSS